MGPKNSPPGESGAHAPRAAECGPRVAASGSLWEMQGLGLPGPCILPCPGGQGTSASQVKHCSDVNPTRSAVPSCPFLPPTPHIVFSDPPNWLGGRWGTSWDSRSQAPCAQFPTVSLEAMLRGFHDQILSGYKLHKAKCLSCRTSQSLEDNCESQTGVVICSIFKTFVVKEYLLPSPTATTSVRAFIRVTNSPRLPRTWEFPGT